MNRVFLILLFLLFINIPTLAIEEDSFVTESLQGRDIEEPLHYLDYNYQNITKIPINLQIMEKIKTENDLYEGQIIKFVITNDVKYNGKIVVKSGAIATARVETIIGNGMNGIPASVVLGNFNIPNIDMKYLTFYYEKFGFDLSLLVYPIKWLLTPFPPTGSLTNFIKGGHVKISEKTKLKIYYYPL